MAFGVVVSVEPPPILSAEESLARGGAKAFAETLGALAAETDGRVIGRVEAGDDDEGAEATVEIRGLEL